MQDTLYYLPTEAHALGWQQQGLAQRLYSQASLSQPSSSAMSDKAGTSALDTSAGTRRVQQQQQQQPASLGLTAKPEKASARSAQDKLQSAETQPCSEWTDQPVMGESRSRSKEHVSQQFQLPSPFNERPRIGSRIFVQSHFPGIAGAMASEMLSWQEDTRLRCGLSCMNLPGVQYYCIV